MEEGGFAESAPPPPLKLMRSNSISRLLKRTGSESAHRWFSALLRTPSSSSSHRNFFSLEDFFGTSPGAALPEPSSTNLPQSYMADFSSMAGAEQESMYAQPQDSTSPPVLQSLRTDPSSDRFGFALEFSPEDLSCAKSAKWSYSAILRQLFVNMNNVCPITLSTREMIPDGTILRAQLQYSQSAHKLKPVVRCPTHLVQHDKTDPVPPAHVLRCDNAQCRYEMSQDGFCSVIIPVTVSKETSTLQQTELFKMMCFSSCNGGINRRPVDIVFTLEHGGKILCTQSISIRVCACPGRDRKTIERASAANVLTTIKRSNSSGPNSASAAAAAASAAASMPQHQPIIPVPAYPHDEAEGMYPGDEEVRGAFGDGGESAEDRDAQNGGHGFRAPASRKLGDKGAASPVLSAANGGRAANGVKQIVTTIDKQLPYEEDDMREYVVQVRGYENFLMVSKVVDALHDALQRKTQQDSDDSGTPPTKRAKGDASEATESEASKDKFAQIKDVSSWAKVFGLAKYEKALLSAGFDDLELIETITAQDLEKIGVKEEDQEAILKAAKQLLQVPEVHKHNMLRAHAPQPDAKFTRLVFIKRQTSQAPPSSSPKK